MNTPAVPRKWSVDVRKVGKVSKRKLDEGDRWTVDVRFFREGAKARHRQNFETLAAADANATTIRARLTAGLDPFRESEAEKPVVSMTVLEVVDLYAARKADAPISDRGEQHRAAFAKTALGTKPADSFELADLEGFLAERDASAATCGKDFRHLKAALAYAKARGKIERHFFEKLAGDKTNRRRLMPTARPEDSIGKAIPPEHLDAILAKLNPKARRAVLFARATGCRKGEVCALDWKMRSAEGFRPITQKGSKPRIVSREKALLGDHGIGLVFAELGTTADAIAEKLTAAWRYAVVEAKVGHYRFHDLRHSFGTDLGKGRNSAEVAAIMGISEQMAKVYCHRDAEKLQIEAIEAARRG